MERIKALTAHLERALQVLQNPVEPVLIALKKDLQSVEQNHSTYTTDRNPDRDRKFPIDGQSLVAVRNSKVLNDSYDKSFVLLEHKVKIGRELKSFYSLYMHLKYNGEKNCQSSVPIFLWNEHKIKENLV